MRNETTIRDQAKGTNWHTTIFIAVFHVGAVAALFMFSWQVLVVAIVLWRITASLRHGFSQTPDASWLQNAKDSRIFSDRLRRTRAGRGATSNGW